MEAANPDEEVARTRVLRQHDLFPPSPVIAFSILKAGCLIWVGAIGFWNVVAGLRQAWQLSRQKIRATDGVILSSRVASGRDFGVVAGDALFYWPAVSFSYEVDGERLTGDRISIAVVRTSDESQVVRKLQR
ncbi:MAG TPA: hypothetical protein VGO11_10990, partial [Chthoniobacteraceae bacterium]|nr:hypothetical protein [Chthoniobacteraceae bacterium]